MSELVIVSGYNKHSWPSQLYVLVSLLGVLEASDEAGGVDEDTLSG
jgi:hypothetical protein